VKRKAKKVVDAMLEGRYDSDGDDIYAGTVNYWLDPHGNLHRVDQHIPWARKNVLNDEATEFGGVYDKMFARKWFRIVVMISDKITVRGRLEGLTPSQKRGLWALSAKHGHKDIVDEITFREID
jgi:hypothetical protein